MTKLTTKQALCDYVCQFAGEEAAASYDYYITDDQVAQDFVNAIGDGDINDFMGNIQRYFFDEDYQQELKAFMGSELISH